MKQTTRLRSSMRLPVRPLRHLLRIRLDIMNKLLCRLSMSSTSSTTLRHQVVLSRSPV
jgi:hypothetical protein